MSKVENFNGTVTKQTVNSRKLSFGKKIRTLTISDLHSYTSNATRASRLAEEIKRQEPDVIFIAGDLFNGGKPWEGGDKFDEFRKFIDNISEAAPVCITWGNHDLIGFNENTKETRMRNFRNLENIRSGAVNPLYNDRVIVNGMEIIGFVPPYELMGDHGLQTQIHGIAHDEFISKYEEQGVKFTESDTLVTAYLGHDPHLIAASENGVGLGSFSVCDYFITGHLHDGYKPLLSIIDKAKKKLTGKGLEILEHDKGLVEQPTGVVDKNGVLIKGSQKLLGPTNLCRGIVYFDDNAQQKIWQSQEGKFFKNASDKDNVQVWQPIMEELARKEIIDNKLHFMLISDGISPSFVPSEKVATINVVDIVSDEEITRKK